MQMMMCLFAITFITSIYIISVYLTLYLSPTMDNKNDDDNNSIISMKLLIIAICTVSHNAFIVTLSMFSSTTPQSPILRKRGQTTDIQSLVILSRLLQKTPIPYPFWEHRVEAHKNSLHNIPRINPLRISCFLWVAICKCISQSFSLLPPG